MCWWKDIMKNEEEIGIRRLHAYVYCMLQLNICFLKFGVLFWEPPLPPSSLLFQWFLYCITLFFIDLILWILSTCHEKSAQRVSIFCHTGIALAGVMGRRSLSLVNSVCFFNTLLKLYGLICEFMRLSGCMASIKFFVWSDFFIFFIGCDFFILWPLF